MAIKGTTPAYMNIVRKTIMDKVPTLAIHDVEFRKNSGILYDEVVAHRLGLLTLKTDLKSYELPKEGVTDDPRSSVVLTLAAKGPGFVFAEDIKSKDPAVKPVFPKTPIAYLTKGQELEVEARALMGQGEEHAKWSPGIAFYRYKPELKVKGTPQDADRLAKLPGKVIEVKGGKVSVNNDNLALMQTYNVFEDIDPALTLEQKEDEFVFEIESWGQLSCKEMLSTAIDLFDAQLDEFDALLKKA